MSWSRFGTICIPDTRPAKVCLGSCSRSSRFSRKRWKQWESWCGRWSIMRRMTRSLLPPVRQRRMTVLGRCAFVRRTKTSVSVLSAHGSFNWTEGATSCAMKPALWPSSGSSPNRFPTTWLWSATVQMASRACLDGAQRLRLLPYLSTPTLKTFRRIGENGTHQSGKPACWPNRYSTHGTTPCCFGT